MKPKECIFWWSGAGLIAAIVLAAQFWKLPDASNRTSRLTANGIWHRTAAVELTTWEKRFFGRAKVVKQLASVQQQHVALTVVDGSYNRRAVHDPEFCFRGAGWEVLRSSTVNLPNGRAKLLSLRKGPDTAEALFWFADGSEAYCESSRYWLSTTLRRLSFGRSGEEPVLVLLTSLDAQAPRWNELISRWPELSRL